MFTLPSSISELPDINQGLAHSRYEQVSCSRDLTGNNFANGQQSFKFEVSGNKHWVPSKSYIRLRLQYVQKDNNNDISPLRANYTLPPFLCANLFQSCEFRIADQTVGKIGQYVAQVDAFKNRITKAGVWLEIMNPLNATSADKNQRNELIQGVDVNEPASYTEFMWRPPLNIFDQPTLPAGKYELILNPEASSQWRVNAILSEASNKVAGTDFDVIVKDMYLYIHTVEGPNVSNTTYALDLENYHCQADKVQSTDTNQRYFDVSPSTVALAVAYQDLRTNQSNMSSSIFRVSGQNLDHWGEGTEQNKINHFYISYAGMQKPSPNMDNNPDNAKYNLVQRYVENQLENGLLHGDAGPERYEDWKERGMYLLFNFPKNGEDASTRVQVSQSFKNADVSNMRILLFSISRTSAEITVANGAVSNIILKER